MPTEFGKVFNIFDQHKSGNQCHNETSLHSYQDSYYLQKEKDS